MMSYNEQPGFYIDQKAAEAYRMDIESVLGPLSTYRHTVDLGAGTGIFTRFLTSSGLSVVGVDQDGTLIEQSRLLLPGVPLEVADFTSHDSIQRLASAYPSFDLLTARYVMHELADPIRTFSAWKPLLVPGGKLLLIENSWIRTDWGWSEWSKRADELPLAYTQTWATAAYCLQQAGYAVVCSQWMSAVNSLESMRLLSGFRLYMIVAQPLS